MTIDLGNSAVSFLFFGGMCLWTFLAIWSGCEHEQDWARALTFFVGVVLGLVALIALGFVVTNALRAGH